MSRKLLAMQVATGLLVIAAAWFFVPLLRDGAGQYNNVNARWTIRGHCIDAQNGKNLTNAEVTIYSKEPVHLKHHWRSPPPVKTARLLMNTDSDGRFEWAGQGGSVVIRVDAKGYLSDFWDHVALDKATNINTNVIFRLQPGNE
jgi:hypothetical protein